MAALVNPADIALQATLPRLVTVTLPGNVVLSAGAVQTPMITTNAVTVPVSISHGARPGTGAYLTAATASITLTVAAAIQVIFACVQGYSGPTPITRFRVKHNGATTPYLYDSGDNAATNTNPVICAKATGTVGVNTLVVEWYSATSAAAIDQGTLFLTGLMK